MSKKNIQKSLCISLFLPPLPLKDKLSLQQKLWDLLDYKKKVNKSDTNNITFCNLAKSSDGFSVIGFVLLRSWPDHPKQNCWNLTSFIEVRDLKEAVTASTFKKSKNIFFLCFGPVPFLCILISFYDNLFDNICWVFGPAFEWCPHLKAVWNTF